MRKNSLCYCDTCILKILAIFLVMIAHWFRYFQLESPIYGLKSIGFFGASLFAFLSGYVSELKDDLVWGGNWVKKKIEKVYIPFAFTNVLFLGIYKSEEIILARVLLGTDDGVLWYVPFIMVFYIVYWNIKKAEWNIKLLIPISIVVTILLESIGLSSQWFTSIGALVAGIFMAKMDRLTKVKGHIILGICVFCGLIFSMIMSIRFGQNAIIKDWMTIACGICFCIFLYLIAICMPTYDFPKFKKLTLNISVLTYWIYLVHMKVAIIIVQNGIDSIVLYVLFSVGAAYVISNLYVLGSKEWKKVKMMIWKR